MAPAVKFGLLRHTAVLLALVTITSSIQHEKPWISNKPTTSSTASIDTNSGLLSHHHKTSKNHNTADTGMEDWVNSRLGAVEQRLNWKYQNINSKLSKMNHTLEISHLGKLFHMVNEELQISQEREMEKDATIKDLKETAAEQSKELHHLKKRMGHIEKTLQELKNLVLGNSKDLDDDGDNKNWDIKQHVTTTEPISSGSPLAPGEINRQATTTQIPDVKPLVPKDCDTAYRYGGVHVGGNSDKTFVDIQPLLTKQKFRVLCDIQRNEGWTVIQKRFDGTVEFFRDWKDYKHGFGDLAGEFWLGLENIYRITNQGDYKLRIEMQSWEGRDYWAEYDHFRISNEDDNYRLHIHGYHGDAGDSLTSRWENHNGQPFSTKDNDNDGRYYDNCANHYKGAWWFTSCFESHLNGQYYHKGSHNNYFVRNGIQWNTIHIHSSLRSVTMMVLPNDDVVEPPKIKTEEDINGIE